jgi:hypothetical protein
MSSADSRAIPIDREKSSSGLRISHWGHLRSGGIGRTDYFSQTGHFFNLERRFLEWEDGGI